jgi:hypothetical protein
VRGGVALDVSGSAPWLGGGAQAALVWCIINGRLVKKMAGALVLQGGGGHWAGIYRAISGMLRKDYSIYSISNLHLILMISGWIRRKGKILIGYNLVISLPSICHCRVGKGKGPGGGGL